MTSFDSALKECAQRVYNYLLDPQHAPAFVHPHLSEAIYAYPKAGGKALRPALLLWACAAVGGDESRALPAAAAVELYHTWTLVHDDIIDRDDTRRGQPTVHARFRDLAQNELGYSPAAAAHYGLTLGILAGDMQQGWCVQLLTRLWSECGVTPEVTLALLADLFGRVQIGLLDGEALDVLFERLPFEDLSEAQILDMLYKKTGILYDFAGRAGAAIGLGQADLHAPLVARLAAFAGDCGVAFQLQDDVLALVAEVGKLGKPVGNDIREGKRTLIALHSLPKLSATERAFALSILGKREATAAEIAEVTGLFASGIAYVKGLASEMIAKGLDSLRDLPPSEGRRLLEAWGRYLIEREL